MLIFNNIETTKSDFVNVTLNDLNGVEKENAIIITNAMKR